MKSQTAIAKTPAFSKVGTIPLASIVRQLQLSPQFKSLAPSTRRGSERALQRLEPLGAMLVADIRRTHLLSVLDALHDTPGEAHLFISACNRLFNYALERELVEFNPASALKRPKLGTHAQWNKEDLESFLSRAREDIKLPILLCLYTGQRIGDVLNMKWDDIQEGYIYVRQQKTGRELQIPIHPALELHLEQRKLNRALDLSGRICSDSSGVDCFRTCFNRERARLGLPQLRIHGLRKTCASMLAEAGATSAEIAAVGGWKSLAHVALYTAQASQKKLATSAMGKMTA